MGKEVRRIGTPAALARTLLVSVALWATCGGEGGPTPPTASTGTITVTFSTTGIRPDPTYTVTLDGGSTKAPSSNSTATFTNVPPGSHVIAVSDIEANCTPESTERTVSVTAGQTAQVPISVECGRLIFVGGWASGGFRVIDDVSFTERVRGLTTGYSPIDASATADGRTLYFSMWKSNADDGLGIVSTENLEFIERIPFNGSPLQVELSTDETEAWVLHDEGAVSFVDLVARAEVHRLEFAGSNMTRDMAVLPDRSRLYVVDERLARVYVIDPAGRRLVRAVSTPQDAVAVAVSPDGSRVYVRTNDFSTNTNKLLILDTATNTIAQTIDLAGSGFSILPHPDGTVIYVPYAIEERIAILDATSFVETGSVTLAAPARLFMSEDRTRLYVTQRSSQLAVLDPQTLEILAQADVGAEPWSVVVYPPH